MLLCLSAALSLCCSISLLLYLSAALTLMLLYLSVALSLCCFISLLLYLSAALSLCCFISLLLYLSAEPASRYAESRLCGCHRATLKQIDAVVEAAEKRRQGNLVRKFLTRIPNVKIDHGALTPLALGHRRWAFQFLHIVLLRCCEVSV